MPANKNTSVSIAKGIAIIAVVLGHAGAPGNLSYMMYEFHMPLFFITAGYFFNLKYLENEGEFVKRRFKGLYVPFVKWSLVFLLLYNVWFKIGFMNELYGNSNGGLLHPYSWHQIIQNAVSICVNMSGYDVCMGGTFWFFRALLIASIIFLFFYKFLSRYRLSKELTTGIICVTALLAATLLVSYQLKITGLPQGGYRDIMGIFFFGVGFLYHSWESYLKQDKYYFPIFIYLLVMTLWCYLRLPIGMPFSTRQTSAIFMMILPAISGFLLIHQISKWIDNHPTHVRQFLVFCGNNTLYVFIFHFTVFKLVSLLKIWYYGMDYNRMGYYPVIHEYTDDYFWIIYTIAGVGIPLLWIFYYRKFKNYRLNNQKKKCTFA